MLATASAITLLLATLAASPSPRPLPAPIQDAPPAGGSVLREVEVPMRDGARLLTDVWLPADELLPVPALLIRTPYGRRYEQRPVRRWVGRGYAVVVQAVRGKDGSPGEWIPWERDLEDGRDAIDWVARQDWCTGRVGMTGGSYLGHVQILAAAAGHPALACIVPLSPGSDGFSDVPFSGGILNLGLIGWLHMCRGPRLDRTGDFPASARDTNLALLPVADIDEAWAGYRSDVWQHWVSVETLTDMPGLTVWDHLQAATQKTPALHIGGLWDPESMATRRNWEQFGALGGPHQYLVFGPWPHEPNQSTRYADVDYGEQAIIELDDLIRRWYAHWLRDGADGASRATAGGPANATANGPDTGPDFPRVQVFATGANRWLHLDAWPAADARPREFHLAGDGDDAHLADAPPEEPGSLSWTFDPRRFPSTSKDQSFNRSTRLWFDGDDPDALVFVTEPFEDDTLLTGPAELELALESSAQDTDLFALLVEVDRRGRVRALQRPSPLRVRFREGFDRAVPLVPGEVHTVRWSLGIFAHEFEQGSRLGLAIRSDWFPTYALNLGTLEPMATATRAVVQRNRIQVGPERVSVLRVYEVPRERLVAD